MLWLRGLFQSHLDLAFAPARGVRARIVDRPGLWMQPAALEKLVADIRAVASETLPAGQLNYGVLGGDPERLKASVLTIVYDAETRRPIAFNALAWMPMSLRGRAVDVLHMGLVMVSPTARSQGLSWILYGLTCFLLFARGGMRPIWISNVTQVPAVVGMVTESFAHVYPTPDDTPQTFEHLLIARQIMRHHRHVFGVGADAGFDEAHAVITNAYTGGSDDLKKTFDQTTKHRQAKYNDLCARLLDYARGDDILQVGQVNMTAAQKYAFTEVPRDSLPGLVLSGGFLGLQSVFLPLIHWLGCEEALGIAQALAECAFMSEFTYDEFVTRNLGFVTPEEQAKLRAARVFIPGVGGMGGAAFMLLVRAGVGHFAIADIDTFEVSNLNRQLFATLDTVDKSKVESAAAGARRINPEVQLEVMGGEWLDRIEDLAARHPVIINGTDDAKAGVRMYRVAREKRATVIDAYAATLPSVYVVKPNDPRPEERMRYPTVGQDWTTITDADRMQCLNRELEWALTHSNTHRYVDLAIAAELAAGKRKRFSFAPMVVSTGALMAYEAIRLILGRPGGADHRGYFFNPHTPGVERPLPWPLSAAKGALVRRFMAKMGAA